MSSTNKTAKLKLPQFTATDTPTWLTDVNNAFKAIDDNVGKVTRTATVVVGLESSGYTENQVDVLIKTTDNNVVSKINEAIGKLPAIGGEIKFLEGTYNINGEVQIRKDNILFSGVGNATKFVSSYNFWVIYSKNVFNKNIVFNRTNAVTPISIQPNASAIFSMCEFNGISCQGICSSFSQCINTDSYNKTASNWENIWIDGVASSPDGSIKKWQDGRMEIMGRIDMTNEPTFKTITLPIAFNGSFRVFACSLMGSSSYGTNDCVYGQFNFYREMPAESNYFNYLAIGRWK